MSAPEKPEDQDFSGFAEALKLTEKAVSDTPLTDAQETEASLFTDPHAIRSVVLSEFARQLERDRARLIKELRHICRLLEPLEANGRMEIPGLATLNGARALLKELQ